MRTRDYVWINHMLWVFIHQNNLFFWDGLVRRHTTDALYFNGFLDAVTLSSMGHNVANTLPIKYYAIFTLIITSKPCWVVYSHKIRRMSRIPYKWQSNGHETQPSQSTKSDRPGEHAHWHEHSTRFRPVFRAKYYVFGQDLRCWKAMLKTTGMAIPDGHCVLVENATLTRENITQGSEKIVNYNLL